MKYVFITLAFIFILLLIILFLKLKIIISYELRKGKNELTIQFSVLRFIKYKMHISKEKVEEAISYLSDEIVKDEQEEKSRGTSLNDLYYYIQNIKNFNSYFIYALGFHKIIKKFLKKIKVHDLQWQTSFGAGDAALTGSLVGGLWAAKGNLVGLLGNYFQLKKRPHIMIEPKFDQPTLNTSFLCIFSFRIGHAIFAGIRLIRHFKKGKPSFSRRAKQTEGGNINV